MPGLVRLGHRIHSSDWRDHVDTSTSTNHGESNNANANGGFSRRTFVKGGLAASVAALGGMALSGLSLIHI